MKKERQLTKELRFLGLTQIEAAKILETSKQVVSDWATGKSRISPAFVIKLKEIGVPMSAIRNPSEMV